VRLEPVLSDLQPVYGVGKGWEGVRVRAPRVFLPNRESPGSWRVCSPQLHLHALLGLRALPRRGRAVHRERPVCARHLRCSPEPRAYVNWAQFSRPGLLDYKYL